MKTKRLGRRIFFSREIGSTNDWARQLASLGADEGTVALAETQTAGKGRLNREWVSPKGGLWFSVILRPRLVASEAAKLVFAAGLSVAEALCELYNLHVETKWPNDVTVNGRKICGILAEMNTSGEKANYVVVGFGLNANFNAHRVFPESLQETATSLENELGEKVQIGQLFRALLEKLESIYDSFSKEGFAPVLSKWKENAVFLNRRVEVASAGEKLAGLALDVDNDGALILKLENGSLKKILVGDVSLR